MALKHIVGIFSLLSGVIAVPCAAPAAGTGSNYTTISNSTSSPPKMSLVPVVNSGVRTAGRHIVPQKQVNLAWQTNNKESLVTVGLSMQNAAVVLEDISEVVAVDCTGNASVSISFNTTDAFNEAISEWSAMNDSFVMITNHLGDCDAELERSFFVADSDNLASFETNLTIIAQAEKSDVVSTASKSILFEILSLEG